MDVEFNTPIPVTFLESMRCVFFFAPQVVADTFDNIPQFYLDIFEKKNPDNSQRLYITFKIPDTVYFFDTDAMRAKADGVALHLKDYLKKHFGNKLAIIEAPLVRHLDKTPYPMKDVIFDLFNRKQMINEEVVVDYMTASKSLDEDMGCNLVRISPALLSAYVFNFSDNPPDANSPYTVLRGKALLLGEPMFFEVDNMSDYQVERDVLPEFVSAHLVEDTLNHTLRVIHEKDGNAKETYIRDVKLTPNY